MQTQCFHCGEPNPPNNDLFIENNQGKQAVCCIGCQAVANSILEGGFSQYYQFREVKADKASQTENTQDTAYDEESVQAEFVEFAQGQATADLTIENMHCAACAWLIEKRLLKISGLKSISVNLVQSRAKISWDPAQVRLSSIFAAIRHIGYLPAPFKISDVEANYKKINRQYLKQLVVSGLFTMQVMMMAFALYFGVLEQGFNQYFRWLSLLLTTPVVFYSGLGMLNSAYKSLKNKSLNMDVPVVFAILGTYLASCYATFTSSGEVYFESVSMFVFLLLLSRYLEHLVRAKSVNVSTNMLKILPLIAYKKATADFQPISANLLQADDIVMVKIGEVVPADGILISDTASFDESIITGESTQQIKQAGQSVFAGTLVTDNQVLIKITAAGKATTLSQIAQRQTLVSNNKSKLATAADKVAKDATLGILILSALTFIIWEFVIGESGLWYAVAVLVATCPCALSLALPTALSASTNNLKRHGILINNSHALESAEKISAYCFDKTGTITTGAFKIKQFEFKSDINSQQMLAQIAAIEAYSNHPIASAFSTPSSEFGIDDFTIIPGSGISAKIQNDLIELTSLRHIQQKDLYPEANIYVLKNKQIVGAIWLEDEIRSSAYDTMKQLKGYKCILSGDPSNRVKQVAQQLDINYQENLTPDEKVQQLIQIRKQYGRVAMVGDGVNDAIVLAEADISIAMNNASEISKLKSDVILLNNNLTKIVTLKRHSGRLNQIIKQNFVWAIGYNTLVLPLAVSGYLTPWIAVLGMSVSSLIVVTNSLRLIK